MKKIYVNLIGTDGSGKTTVSEALVKELNGEAEMVWCGAESIIMWPIRFLLNLLARFKAEHSQNADYILDVNKKKKIASRSKFLTNIYIKMVLLDYVVQYKWKMWKTRKSKYVVLDRYFFDVAVNLAIRLGWSPEELIVFIEKNIHRFHLPQLRVWVRVPPEVSMARKDDVPDISYLQLRIDYYESIARRFGFNEINGELRIEENVSLLKEKLDVIGSHKNIMYVHSNNEDVGGADFCLYRLADEFKHKGFQVSCALRLPSFIIDKYRESGIPVYNKYFSRPQLSRGFISILLLPFRSLLDVVYFLRLFKTQSPDIVHVNDLYDFGPAIAGTLLGLPVVYHIRMIRTNEMETALFRSVVRWFSTTSVSVSTPVNEHYFGKDAAKDKKHQVIYDWPNDEFLGLSKPDKTPDGMDVDKINVVMVGRLEFWKGQHIFLDAIEILNNKEVTDKVNFYLVGGSVKGQSKEKYSSEIIEKAKKIKNVIYLGARSDVKEILSFSDISVHASVTPDPFPGVALESLLSGAATIGANAGGLTEMIRNNVDGYLFEPGNAEELSDKLKSLIESEELRKLFSSSGTKRITKMTDKALLLHKFEEVYVNNDETKYE